MGLFNQNDNYDPLRENAPDFSGRDLVDPDSENETSRPIEPSEQQDTSEVAPVDDAAGYSRSVEQPETQEQDLSGIQIPAEDAAAQYAVQGQSIPGMNDPNSPVPQPNYDSYLTYTDRTPYNQAWIAQKTAESKENIKPSIGRKILAALAGGAITFGSRDPSKGQAAIESILGAPQANAEARWKQQEMPLVAQGQVLTAQDAATQRANQGIDANNTLKERNYRTQVVNQYDQGRVANAADAAYQKSLTLQPVDQKNLFGEWQLVDRNGNVAARGQEPPNSVKNDPQYKAQQDANEITARQKIAAGNPNLKPGSEAYNNFVYKIPLSTHTSINVREGNGANGQPKPMTQAQKDVILQAKQRDMTAAQNQMASGVLSPKDGAAQMQSIQDTFEQKVGVDPDSPAHMTINPDFTWSRGGQRVASPAAQTQAPQQQQHAPQQQGAPAATKTSSGRTVKIGDPITLNGRTGTVAGINPSTGKIIPKWN